MLRIRTMRFLYSKKLSMIILLCLLVFIIVDADSDTGGNADQNKVGIHIINGIHDDYNGNDHDYDDYDFYAPDSRVWSGIADSHHSLSFAMSTPCHNVSHGSPQGHVVDGTAPIAGVHFLDYSVWSRGSFV
jgi:hypothetical protein